MGISLGLVGLGAFGSGFAPLFKSHPLVDRIALCDREPDRIEKFAKDPSFQDKFDEKDAYPTLDEELFDKYLKAALQAPPDILPDNKLLTAIARDKAQKLIVKKEQLF